MKDDQVERGNLTPDEIAKIKRSELELLETWIKNLSPEESKTWLDAHSDDLETGLEALLEETADFTTILRVAAPIMQEHPNMVLGAALEIIRKKDQRTLAEAEALDAFERVKNKPSQTKK